MLRVPFLEGVSRFNELALVKKTVTSFEIGIRRESGGDHHLGSSVGCTKRQRQENDEQAVERASHRSPGSEQSRNETRLTGHSGAVIGIRKEHAFLRGKPLKKNRHVSGRSGDGGDPRSVNQGQYEHLN